MKLKLETETSTVFATYGTSFKYTLLNYLRILNRKLLEK